MTAYRALPMIVEALQWDGDRAALLAWIGPDTGLPIILHYDGQVDIGTLHGIEPVEVGGWIVRLPDGAFETMDADTFARTYEPAP